MKQFTIFTFGLIVFCLFNQDKCCAQVFTGGNISVSYENGLYADISPVVGYQYQQLRAGVSPLFAYKKPLADSDFISMGGRIFSQYTIIQGAFAHAELQAINSMTFRTGADGTRTSTRNWTYGLPVGGGYEHRISDKARAQVTVLYDILNKNNNPNQGPTIRGGIFYDF